MSLIIEALSAHHDKASFDCGNDQLNRYLAKQAKQDVKRKISRVFVMIDDATSTQILGFYTLSSLAIELVDLPQSLATKLPKHPVPAALIGRLAVAKQTQGQKLGQRLLVDAIKRTLRISQELAIYAIVVDAIDAHSAGFYQKFGFSPLKEQRYFLPLKSIG